MDHGHGAGVTCIMGHVGPRSRGSKVSWVMASVSHRSCGSKP